MFASSTRQLFKLNEVLVNRSASLRLDRPSATDADFKNISFEFDQHGKVSFKAPKKTLTEFQVKDSRYELIILRREIPCGQHKGLQQFPSGLGPRSCRQVYG
ncbi:hypothetical protein L596_030660 [Steinernema carpocapsae]|uniref:Uncharacterized protein n=1 Tax=Steinernema carpocapsae TaxID=34508 RepID=A0A4U5LQ16_STECR|nr:hypothetical protein L596_030660 [Steinernema carpocapsae]